MSIPAKDDKKEEYLQGNKRQNIKENKRDLVGKSLDNKSVRDRLFRHTPQNRLFASDLTLSLREIRFYK